MIDVTTVTLEDKAALLKKRLREFKGNVADKSIEENAPDTIDLDLSGPEGDNFYLNYGCPLMAAQRLGLPFHLHNEWDHKYGPCIIPAFQKAKEEGDDAIDRIIEQFIAPLRDSYNG